MIALQIKLEKSGSRPMLDTPLVFHRSAQQKPVARTLGAIALASNPMPIAGPHKPRSTLILARNRVGYRAPFLDRTQRSLPYYIENWAIQQSTCASLTTLGEAAAERRALRQRAIEDFPIAMPSGGHC